MALSLINPLVDAEAWNREALGFDQANVFHSAEWARLLASCYGYEPHYAACGEAALPVLDVASCFNGRRGVSVPFADACEPLIRPGVGAECIIEPIKAIGAGSEWEYLEVRGGPVPSGASQAGAFVEHRIGLEESEAVLLARLHDSHRRNIRKALREGVEVDVLETREAMNAYYRLHCLTRQRLGAPPQPPKFFRLLHEHLVARGLGAILLARHDGRYIAGAVCLQFGRNAIYKFGASDVAVQQVRANNLVLWHAIRHFRDAGAKSFSLGRTDLPNHGLLQFKRGWGGEELPVRYHRIGIRKPSMEGEPRASLWAGVGPELFRRMPIPLLRAVGSLVYPHLG